MIRRRANKKNIYVYLVLGTLLILVFFLANGVWGVYEKSRVTKERRDELLTELEVLKARRMELEALTASLKTDRGL